MPPLPDAPVDAPVDGTTPIACSATAGFQVPMLLPGMERENGGAARLSPTELTLYYTNTMVHDVFRATRGVRTSSFVPRGPITELNGDFLNVDPTVSSDETHVWIATDRPMLGGPLDLYTATRSDIQGPFEQPTLLATVNSADPDVSDGQPFITADGLELWFTSNRTGGHGNVDIWRSLAVSGGFSAPVNVTELNTPADDWFPMLSADRLTVYFSSRSSSTGMDIWSATRTAVDQPFALPHLVSELNTTGDDFATWLSPDNCRLYGYSTVSGTEAMFVATRQP